MEVVVEHPLGLRIGDTPCGLDRLRDFLVELGRDLLGEVVVEDPLLAEVGLVPVERVTVLPLLALFLGVAVDVRVVGGVVLLHPVGHTLDEGRPFSTPSALDGLLGLFTNREDVVAVDALVGHAVGFALLGEGLRAGLPV